MPRGGKREGAGRPKGAKGPTRPKLPVDKRTVSKSVTLAGADWELLERMGKLQTPELTATCMAAKLIRDHLQAVRNITF